MLYDVIVIGGGPGGYTAALYAARANLSVAILEKLSPGGQMGTTDVIDNYPGFPQGVNGFELAMQMKEGAERFGAQTQLAEVTQVELAGQVKTIHTSGGDYQARTVVLATGAHPRELGLPGERELRGRGVSYCATCDGMFYRGKTVVVVGGGNTAVSDVLYLSRLCEKVYLVHRRDTLRASKVYLDPLQKAENVEFVWDSEVKQLLRDQAVTGVRVRNKKPEKSGISPATASLWRWVICPIRSCTVARWSWMRPGMSWPTRPPRPTCPGCSLWGTCGRSPCARWSPPPATAPWRPTLSRNISTSKKTRLPRGRVFAWVKEKRPSCALFSGSVLLLPHEDEGRHFVAVCLCVIKKQ